MNVKTYEMEDVGRRIDHLMELHDLWSAGLAFSLQGYQTFSDKENAKELKIALNLLNAHITHGYKDVTYARVVNNLPKDAKEIPDEKKPDSPPDFTTHRDTV